MSRRRQNNHNMDPAVVGSAQFGLLFKTLLPGTYPISGQNVAEQIFSQPLVYTGSDGVQYVYIATSDDLGRRFAISPSGQSALTQAGLAGEPVTSFAAPGGSFQSRLAFDVPADARHLGLVKGSHGWFPLRLIIGDPQSWLHRPTVTPLG